MSIPTPAEIVLQVRPLLLVVREALRFGIARAGEFFEREESDPDPWLAAHLARWHAKGYLKGQGHAVHDLDEDYGTEDVSNSGLRGDYKNFRFIVRKPSGGLLPAPVSDTLVAWHAHNECFEFIELDGPIIHLAILWSADSAYHDLLALELALPKAHGDAYWYEPILELDAAEAVEPVEPVIELVDDLENIQLDEGEQDGATGEPS